ncbi:hypothetical protein LC040_03165 [Bacillus tianshenii]|nr:hypothetical protein LC040_03165 [Bacillus tianshenii]
MKLNIVPYESIGPIKLGMPRDEIRSLLNSKVVEFEKSEFDKNTTDAFDELGMHVFYKEDDTCESVEVSEPALAVFDGMNLVGTSFKKAKELLQKYDKGLSIDGNGLISYQLGISLYLEDTDDESLPVEAVMVFERGYYDEIYK